ncbi:MAG: rhodanese-like domain-containing protein [Desulfomicrobium sp.]
MKPPISFGIKTAIILAISVGLALAFNATRPDRLPLVHDPDSIAQAAALRGEISLTDAALLFESGKTVFIDAREAGEFALGHIEGAFSLDPMMFEQQFPELREHLEGAATIVTYCDGEFCELSHELAEQLRGMGLQDVRVLKNGWTLWREQGLPTAVGDQTETPSPQLNATDTEPVDSEAGEAPGQAGMAPEPADMPQLPQPRENAPNQTEPNGTGQMTQPPAPLEHPDSEALHPAPLEPAPQEPGLPEPTPLQPTPLEMPSEEPQMHDANQPDPEAQGEKS